MKNSMSTLCTHPLIDPPPGPRKRGVIFSTFLTTPQPRPPPLPQNLKKVGFKWGGSGGVRTKNSLRDVFIGQNNDFTGG